MAACAATPIENGLIYDELRRVNQRLSVKVFQLHNLFDISRELTASLEEDAIRSLFATTVMGHFVVSRCALYLLRAGRARPRARARRGRAKTRRRSHPPRRGAALEALRGPAAVTEMAPGPLKERLRRSRMGLAVPLARRGTRVEGLLAVGERASGAPFSEEDHDFAQTLARQAVAALESARLHQRAAGEAAPGPGAPDRPRDPAEPLPERRARRSTGFEVAAESRPCFEVGGDYYDFIPLEGGRLALAVADVSGKGTPASILMASVHASLQALAGTASPALLHASALNRFLFASTQANKYVTLFYGELDPARAGSLYVNAATCLPTACASDGRIERLLAGGPAAGPARRRRLRGGGGHARAGDDVVGMVTDGVTEALSPEDEEFGDERACGGARGRRGRDRRGGGPARSRAGGGRLGGCGPCSDDLTALILKAQ